jgi:hypothetical protein
MSESEHPSPYIDAPPQEVLSYIHDMLRALSQLAARQGDFDLAQSIQEASDQHPMEEALPSPPH